MFNTIDEAIQDLKEGKIVIVVDDESRENEGDLVALSEFITAESVNFMITHGRGLVCTSITKAHAKKLNLPVMTENNTDTHETAFTLSIDHQKTTTGISASERALTIKSLTDKAVKASDYKRPGHVFPLIAKENGVFERKGHTEASLDLAKLSGAFPSATICEIIKPDGEMARVPQLEEMAKQFDLKLITIEDLVAYRKEKESLVKREAEAVIPTPYGEFKLIAYTNKLDKKEHLALVKGEINSTEPMLVRIHSECVTGDIFQSERCDCGPQLEKAMELINKKGSGLILYMRQEGRGIGLFNKLKAYNLQDTGLDTVEANQALGFKSDLRDYTLSANILKELKIKQVHLLTNNPKKIEGLTEAGIQVTKRIPLELSAQQHNKDYLATKQEKMGHLLTLNK